MTHSLLTHRWQSCHLGRPFREALGRAKAMVGELAAKCLYTWTALPRDCRQESSCREARHSALFELDSPEAVSSRDEVSYIVSGSSEAGCHGIEEAMSTKRFTTKVQVHSCCHWLYLFHWTPWPGLIGVCVCLLMSIIFLSCPLPAYRMEVSACTPLCWCGLSVWQFSEALIPIKVLNLQWAGGYPRIRAQKQCSRKTVDGSRRD